MAWQYTPYLLALTVASGLSLIVGAIAWRYRETPGARPLVALMLATSWWSLTYILALSRSELAIKMFAFKLMYPAIAVVSVAWLVFAINYTDRTRSLSRREIGGLLVIPGVTVVLFWTNEIHGLIWPSIDLVTRNSIVLMSSTRGPGFWMFAIYSYLLVAIGMGFILRQALLSEHVYRGQSIGLGVAVLLPWGANALYLSGSTGVWDMTNLGLALSGGILMILISRRQFLQLAPIGRNELVEEMSAPVIVIDDQGQVMDLNPAAEELTDYQVEEAIDTPIVNVEPTVADVIDVEATDPPREVITIPDSGRDRRYSVQQYPFQWGYGMLTGMIVTLHDVTKRYQREQRLEHHEQQLEVLNRVLTHDIRNRLTLILGSLDAIPSEQKDLNQAVQTIENESQEILQLSERARQIATMIESDGGRGEVVNLAAVIERITDSLTAEYPDVEIRTDLPERASVEANEMIESAIRNVIENAIEHNDKAHSWVDISVADSKDVRVQITDNGPGLPPMERTVLEERTETSLEHSSGLGLWLATWIVEDSGGEIEITDNKEQGTLITLRFERFDSNPSPSVQD